MGEVGNGKWVDCNWSLFKITRQPFQKRHSWQSLGICLKPQRTCTWNLKLKFQSILELRCRNHALQKPKDLMWPPGSHLENEVTENHWLLPIYISIVPLKFGVDIQSQTKVSPETKKSNMVARRPIWKWLHWKSIGSYPHTHTHIYIYI